MAAHLDLPELCAPALVLKHLLQLLPVVAGRHKVLHQFCIRDGLALPPHTQGRSRSGVAGKKMDALQAGRSGRRLPSPLPWLDVQEVCADWLPYGTQSKSHDTVMAGRKCHTRGQHSFHIQILGAHQHPAVPA